MYRNTPKHYQNSEFIGIYTLNPYLSVYYLYLVDTIHSPILIMCNGKELMYIEWDFVDHNMTKIESKLLDILLSPHDPPP